MPFVVHLLFLLQKFGGIAYPFDWLVVKGTVSWTFFGFFSKMARKLQLLVSTFNHAGNFYFS